MEDIAAIYEQHAEAIAAHLRIRYGLSMCDAEDVTHDAFVKAIAKSDTFKGDSKPQTWIQRIAVNMTIDRWRRQQRAATYALDVPRTVDWRNEVDASIDGGVLVEALLASCNERQRTAVCLRVVEEYKPAEIARAMGVTVGAAKSLIYRGKQSMASCVCR